jgi:glycosyltransferase involved in cell wall biosynthesis
MKISVLTPAYNAAQFLPRAIASVVAQQDSDFEHIVIDGGSTDGTQALLKQFDHVDWVSEADRGQSHAMNKAFARCTGDIIVYLNADDWFEPNVFSHVRACFDDRPDGALVIGNLYSRAVGTCAVKLIAPAKDYRRCLQYWRYRYPLNPVSYFYRRQVQECIGPFPEELHYTMDYWFILRALSVFPVVETGLVFGTFYQTGENKTSRGESSEGPWSVASRHVRDFDPKVHLFFYSRWLMHRYGSEFLERNKQPIRSLVYFSYFRKTMSQAEYQRLGFRESWRRLRGSIT